MTNRATPHRRKEKPRVLVVGGGVSGLASAWCLGKAGASVTLLEASDRFGGVIRTTKHDDLVIEHGPDCFISTKPAALQLCRELGIESELISTRPEFRRSFILQRGKLVPIPPGFFLLAPTSIGALVRTPLLSWPGKLRAAMDLVIPATGPDGDESLASFVTRRFGDEVLDRIAQPMVGGIYTADPQKLSLAATYPQFLEFERRQGSVIRGLMKSGSGRGTATEGAKDAAGPRYGLFVSVRDGMGRIVERLVESLDAQDLRTGCEVRRIERDGSAWKAAGETFDGVVLALPNHRAAHILAASMGGGAAELAEWLGKVEYAGCAIVNLAFKTEQVAHRMDGAGFVVPLVEGRQILAASFSHSKWSHRAQAGVALIRVFIGGAVQEPVLNRTDAELIGLALSELDSILGITGQPVFQTISRWQKAMAQFHVGHLSLVARIRELERRVPGFALAGNGFEGVGIPDCIASGRAAAARVMESLCNARGEE